MDLWEKISSDTFSETPPFNTLPTTSQYFLGTNTLKLSLFPKIRLPLVRGGRDLWPELPGLVVDRKGWEET